MGQTQVLNYESLTVPDIQSQSIRLWSDGKYLGVVPVRDVLRNHLSPGNMLSLRGDPPLKSGPPPPSAYDYEVRPLQTDRPESIQQSRPKALRAKEFYLNATVSSERLRLQLRSAYRWLDQRSRGKDAQPPVEFHVKAKGPLSHADLSLFTQKRIDLHPAVILRAMPEGAFQALEPKGDIREGEALWIVGTKYLAAWPYAMPRTPLAIAKKVEKMVDNKKKQLETLIAAGKMTRKGEITKEWRFGMGESLIGDASEEEESTKKPDQ